MLSSLLFQVDDSLTSDLASKVGSGDGSIKVGGEDSCDKVDSGMDDDSQHSNEQDSKGRGSVVIHCAKVDSDMDDDSQHSKEQDSLRQ